MGGRPVNIVEGVAYGLPVTESEFGEPMTPTDGPGEPVIVVDDGGLPVKFINDDMSDYTAGITPAMAMLTAYSRTLTDEVAAYEATYTGASHKTMFDQYGLLTFAPNQLLLQSNTFSTSWTLGNVTIGSDAILGPDGVTYADKIKEDTANNNHSIFQQITSSDADSFVFSVKLKAAERTWARISCDFGAGGYRRFWVNLSAGSIGTSDSATATLIAGPTVIDHGDGWYEVYAVAKSSSGTTRGLFIAAQTADAETTYAGTLNSGIYVHQARISRVTHETAPRACDDVDTTSAAYYGYRCVYAPETLETSTTSITIGSGSSYTFTTAAAHSFAVGDVVQATDNADPDNYVCGYVTDTTSTTVTLASYTFPGTAYSRPVLTNGSGTISDWSVIRSDGYLAEPAATNLLLNSKADGTSLATQGVSLTAQAYTLSFYGTGTVTLSGASTAGPLVGSGAYPTRSTLTFTPTAGTVTFTVTGTVQYAQLETGSVATSYIPTAAAPIDRVADVARLESADFSGWWNATEGTFVAKADISKTTANERIFAASNSGGTDRFQGYAAYPSLTVAVIDGGVSQFSGTDASATEISVMALAYKAGDFNGAVNGTAFTPGTSGTLPTVDTLDIGMFNSGNILYGTVPEILYFPTRESDAQLVTLTGG